MDAEIVSLQAEVAALKEQLRDGHTFALIEFTCDSGSDPYKDNHWHVYRSVLVIATSTDEADIRSTCSRHIAKNKDSDTRYCIFKLPLNCDDKRINVLNAAYIDPDYVDMFKRPIDWEAQDPDPSKLPIYE